MDRQTGRALTKARASERMGVLELVFSYPQHVSLNASERQRIARVVVATHRELTERQMDRVVELSTRHNVRLDRTGPGGKTWQQLIDAFGADVVYAAYEIERHDFLLNMSESERMLATLEVMQKFGMQSAEEFVSLVGIIAEDHAEDPDLGTREGVVRHLWSATPHQVLKVKTEYAF